MAAFQPGQYVIWSYQRPGPGPRIDIAAEIVQPGSLRARIRIRTSSGMTACRWVHPKNLRPMLEEEAANMYPGWR
jgi:hypothetical protein